jgi:predicted nucleic acid-binding protein
LLNCIEQNKWTVCVRAFIQASYCTKEMSEEFGELLPEWIVIKEVTNKKYQQILELSLDKGEASAIALSLELQNVLLILNVLKARKEAKRLGLIFTGTL